MTRVKEAEIQRLVIIRPANEDFISVSEEHCTGCAKCVVVCPALIWKMSHKKASLALDYRNRCLECAGCYQVCEPGAIHFRFPSGGEGIVVGHG